MLPVRQLKDKTLIKCDAHESTARIENTKNSQRTIKRHCNWRIAGNICSAFRFTVEDVHGVKWPNSSSAAKTPDIADRPSSGFGCVSASVCCKL